MKLTLELSGELEQRILAAAAAAGVSPGEYAVQMLDEKLSEPGQRDQAIELLRSWRDPALAQEQKETGEYLVRVMDEDRTSERKLFPPELKGISW
jgi:hypothetical protein